MSKQFSSGVAADFEQVVRRFQQANSVRFEIFASIWRDLKMSCIFSGHETTETLEVFVRECLTIALELSLPPRSFQSRVGGLYLLYAVYFKQPYKLKIRVTLSQWHQLIQFIQEVSQQEHYDAAFTFWKLRIDNAFHFVALAKPLAPHLKTFDQYNGSRFFLESSSVKDIIDVEYSTPLERIHQEYMRRKKELFHEQDAMGLVDGELVSVISKKVEEFERKRMELVDRYLKTDDNEIKKIEGKGKRKRWSKVDKRVSNEDDVKKGKKERQLMREKALREVEIEVKKDLKFDMPSLRD